MTPEETLKELHDTPGDLLTPVEIPGEFKPFANVDSTLIGNLANGKGDIVDGETDNINIVGPDGTGGNVETPEIDPATGQPIPPTQGGNEMEFNVSEFITTDLALSLLGFIIVFLGVLALNKFGKIQIENKELELTPEEKKTLKKPLYPSSITPKS